MWEIVGLVLAILLLLYYNLTSNFDYWKKRGVKGPKPIPFFGTFKDVFLGRMSAGDSYYKAYHDYKDEPMIGLFEGRNPHLILRDLDLVKDVLIKDFSKFADRTITPLENDEPLSEHLFRLEATRWRPLRARLSPVFTSGKLKEMFHLLLESSDYFEKYLDDVVAKGEPIECHEISAKFTTDVIGSFAFGIEMNAMAKEESEFRTMGRKIFETSWRSWMKDRLRPYPILFRIFSPFIVDYSIVDFFRNITKESIEYRIKNQIHRNDFIDTLVDLKQHPEKLELNEMDDTFAAAQAFVFFAAGFETSSITISHALYELALNPSIQEKVRADIQDVLKHTDGKITYDSIKEMKYLDMFMKETLRKYPVLIYLDRSTVESYTFSGTNITIPKGQYVYVPVYAIQNDPENYPDPEVFDPERFTEEASKARHPMLYLPFGDGPRNCIGARFAKNQTKVAIIKVLTKFKVHVCEKTQIPYLADTNTLFLLQPATGIHVKMTKLET